VSASVEDAQAVICIRDTGIGIDATQIPRIFEMFTQLDGSSKRGQSGLVIGLALTKKLVELHGGELTVESEGIGQGSEFTVRLPVLSDPTVPQAAPNVDHATLNTPRRVLVVDDNKDTAESLSRLLETTGSETQTAHDGIQAIEVAQTFRRRHPSRYRTTKAERL
jgi:hypothetical protein